MQEQAEADKTFATVYQSYQAFQKAVSDYHKISEQEYYINRNR